MSNDGAFAAALADTHLPKSTQLLPIWAAERGDMPDRFSCTCANPSRCKSPGKHPIPPKGVLSATNDRRKLAHWAMQHPTANVGAACGVISGFDVLDVDKGKGGFESLKRLEAERGDFPATLLARTGSGGLHLFFRHVAGVRNRIGSIRGRDERGHDRYPGLDVRSDGGYIVLPPSNHASGGRYTWISTDTIAPWPLWLLKLVLTPARDTATFFDMPPDAPFYVPPALKSLAKTGARSGQRNSYAFWYANRVVEEVGPRNAGRNLVLSFAASCKPPLAKDEAIRVWENACETSVFDPTFILVDRTNRETGEVQRRVVRRKIDLDPQPPVTP